MRFIVDECTGPAVARWLSTESHEVFSVYDQARGTSDEDVLAKAYSENWILITNDKEFGELVYREQRPHRGVIFLRLNDERAAVKINAIRQLLLNHSDRLVDAFVVVSETQIRFASR
jgi:predicted nuclease of predicted toxin-antitoxin system